MKNETNELGQPIGFPVPDFTPPPPPPRTSMQGRTCRLEILDRDRHAKDLLAAYDRAEDSRNWTYLPYGPHRDLAAFEAWIEKDASGDDPLFHAVIDLQTEKAVGVASYLRINPAAGSIEVGHIHFSPLMQRGIASTEAMYLMMARAFDALGYRRYEWKCNNLNEASKRAALRLGFTFEGIFRQMLVVKGRNRDSAWFSLLDREWPMVKDAFQTWLDPSNFDAAGNQRQSLSALTAAAKERFPVVK